MASQVATPLDDDEDDIQQDGSAQTDEGEEGDKDTEAGDPLEGKPELQKALYQLYSAFCSEDRFPRICEIMDVQQAHDYWRGLQYRWWSRTGECWNFPNENAGLQGIPENADDMPRFEFVTNIYQAFGLSLISAMSQAPPRTRWFPEDADDPEDVETAEKNSTLSKIIERWNPIQLLLQNEIFYLFTGGTVGGWVRYVSDGEKYGTESVEDLKNEETATPDEVRCAKCGFAAPSEDLPLPAPCPQCGTPLTEDNVAPGQSTSTPSSDGTEEVAKGRETITLAGALNLKRNMYAREQSEFLYLGYEEEIHYAKLRAAYKEIAMKIKPGQGTGEDNGFERNARMAVMQGTNLSQQTGENQTALTTFARVWFRPEAFYHDIIKEEARKELLDIFPRGVRVYFAGPEYCESEEECMDDCWTVQHAFPGDGQHRNALGSSLISVQDRFNTYSNIEAETYEYGIPVTYRAADTWDAAADVSQRSEPGAEIDVMVPAQVDIRNRIMQLRNDSPSPEMLAGMDKLMGPIGQFLTGAFTALQGAGGAEGAAGDTAAGYAMQRDQALGRIGITYARLKQFHADLQTLACKDFCDNASGRVAMSVQGASGDFESESVDVTAIKGNARAYPEGDENFPEMWNQQRATFMQIMDSAQGAALMSDPTNAEKGVKLLGIPGLVLPGADARRRALRIIGKLTKPVPPATQAAPMDVSAFIDQQLDKPRAAAMGQAVSDWLISDTGVKCEDKNPAGFENARQYAIALTGMVPGPEPQIKPVSVSVTVPMDKMPPVVQAELASQELGIQTTADDFIAQAALASEAKSKPTTHASPGVPPPSGNPVAGGPGASNG